MIRLHRRALLAGAASLALSSPAVAALVLRSPSGSAPPLTISGAPVTTGQVSVAYAGFTVVAANGTPAYVYSLVGSWPAGLSINSGTGAVTGTPTLAGTYPNLSVKVTDSLSHTAQLALFTIVIAAGGGGGTQTLTEDGVDIVLDGGLTIGQYVDGSSYVVAPSGVTFYSAAMHPGTPGTNNFIGAVMVEPQGLAYQGWDYRGSVKLSGTAQGGDSTHIILQAGSSAPNTTSTGLKSIVVITGGSGPPAGEASHSESYVAGTLTLAVSPAWSTPPTASTTYEIWSGFGPAQQFRLPLRQTLPITVTPYNGSDGGPSGAPRTIWFYRGLNTVNSSGGAYQGCYALIQVTVLSAAPGANPIKPPGNYVAAGKPQYTTADINYSAVTAVALPAGAVEPPWGSFASPTLGFGSRPILNTGAFGDLGGTYGGFPGSPGVCNPTQTQPAYPANQTPSTAALVLGAICNVANIARTELVNRVVRDGIEAYAQSAFGNSTCISGAGFGSSRILAFFAGVFLGNATIGAKPANVHVVHGYWEPTGIPYYEDDGSTFTGAVGAQFVGDQSWPSGKPLYGDQNGSNPPGPPYGHNNTQRDYINNSRDPHWTVGGYSGTTWTGNVVAARNATSGAQTYISFVAASKTIHRTAGSWIADGFVVGDTLSISGSAGNTPTTANPSIWANIVTAVTASDLTMSAGLVNEAAGPSVTISAASVTLSPTMPQGDLSIGGLQPERLYIASGPGAGQLAAISAWNNVTKVANIGRFPNYPPSFPLWSPTPDATSVYEIYNSGSYNALTMPGQAAGAVATVIAGKVSAWGDTTGFFQYVKYRWITECRSGASAPVPRWPFAPVQDYQVFYDTLTNPYKNWITKFYDTYAAGAWPPQDGSSIQAMIAPSGYINGSVAPTSRQWMTTPGVYVN